MLAVPQLFESMCLYIFHVYLSADYVSGSPAFLVYMSPYISGLYIYQLTMLAVPQLFESTCLYIFQVYLSVDYVSGSPAF